MIYPRFVYTDDASQAVDFTLSVACRQWTSPGKSLGGREETKSGATASWEDREDSRLRLPIRFLESEWPAVLKMLRHGSRGTIVTVHLGAASRTSRLLAPSVFDEAGVEPQKGEFPGELELETLWRDTSGSGWEGVAFYG